MYRLHWKEWYISVCTQHKVKWYSHRYNYSVHVFQLFIMMFHIVSAYSTIVLITKLWTGTFAVFFRLSPPPHTHTQKCQLLTVVPSMQFKYKSYRWVGHIFHRGVDESGMCLNKGVNLSNYSASNNRPRTSKEVCDTEDMHVLIRHAYYYV